MKTRIFQAIYSHLILPLGLFLALIVGVPFVKKVRKGLLLRLKYKRPPIEKNKKLVWFHCSSGEFEYARPLIRKFKENDFSILVTYFSPSYINQIQKDPHVDFVAPLPLDLPGPLQDFINHFKPQMTLIARTDLWPNMLQSLSKKNIPIYLFSVTASKSGSIKNFLTSWAYNYLTKIFTVTKEDSSNLLAMKIKTPLEPMGDTRFDQTKFRLDTSSAPAQLENFSLTIPIFVAGSTWSQDEDKVLPALAPFLRKKIIRLIIAPHEPTKTSLTRLRIKLRKYKLPSILFSEQASIQDNQLENKVLIIDSIGILANLYSLSDFSFVGGSFRGSVHSVMEPIASGSLCFVGPDHENNREALELKKISLTNQPKLQLVNVCKNSSEMSSKLELALQQNREQIKSQIHSEFTKRLGATNKIFFDITNSSS